MQAKAPHRKLGDLLVEGRVIDPEQLRAAIGHQRRWGGRLGEILVGLGFASERSISQALSRQLGLPEVNLASLAVSENVIARVPFELCQRHRLMPLALRRDEKGPFLHVAMSDPSDLEALDDLRFQTGVRIEAVVAPEIEIEDAIRKHYQREIERSSPFGESRKLHQSTGELLRFGEQPVDMESGAGVLGAELPLEADEGGATAAAAPAEAAPAPPPAPAEDPFKAADPALGAVEALVRILARKGILEKGEYLEELLRAHDEDPPET